MAVSNSHPSLSPLSVHGPAVASISVPPLASQWATEPTPEATADAPPTVRYHVVHVHHEHVRFESGPQDETAHQRSLLQLEGALCFLSDEIASYVGSTLFCDYHVEWRESVWKRHWPEDLEVPPRSDQDWFPYPP